MASPSRFKLLPFLLHSASSALMAYGWFGLQKLPITNWINTQSGGHLQFLTIQGLFVAWLAMVISAIYDLTSLGFVRTLKRILFMIALPLSIVISSVYWTLLLVMPTLILRPERSAAESEPSSSSAAPAVFRIPLSIDLALHAVPAIALLIDFIAFEKKYSHGQARYGGFVVAALAGLGYSNWAEYCAKLNGEFPYPFLTNSPYEVRIAIYVVLTFFAYSFFVWLNSLHR